MKTRTSNSEVIEQFVDVLLVTIGREAVSVDVGSGVMSEAGYVSGCQS